MKVHSTRIQKKSSRHIYQQRRQHQRVNYTQTDTKHSGIDNGFFYWIDYSHANHESTEEKKLLQRHKIIQVLGVPNSDKDIFG